MEDSDQGKEALDNLLKHAEDRSSAKEDDGQLSKEDDNVPPSPSSSEEEEEEEERIADEKEDEKCKVMVDYYMAQLEDIEHKTDLYHFWFMEREEPNLKNLNTEYQCRRDQLVEWNDEGRDNRIQRILDMLHNAYLNTCEFVVKPRKSTRTRSLSAKAQANAAARTTTESLSLKDPTSKKQNKSTQRSQTQTASKPKPKRSAGRGKDTESSSVPPKKRINRGDSKNNRVDKTSADNVNPPKPPKETKHKKAVVLKNGTLKRSVYSRPTSVSGMKDQTSRNKFQCCAKHIKELQYCTTLESAAERKFNPKVQHFMFTYDELVQKPHQNKALPIRPKPVCIFLPPEGIRLKEFAKVLKRVADEMEKNSGKGYHIAKSEEEYSKLVYGPNLPPSSSKARPKAGKKS